MAKKRGKQRPIRVGVVGVGQDLRFRERVPTGGQG